MKNSKQFAKILKKETQIYVLICVDVTQTNDENFVEFENFHQVKDFQKIFDHTQIEILIQ